MADLKAREQQFEEALSEELRKMKEPLNDRMQNINMEKENMVR